MFLAPPHCIWTSSASKKHIVSKNFKIPPKTTHNDMERESVITKVMHLSNTLYDHKILHQTGDKTNSIHVFNYL